jgi:hypothetical protein
LKKENVCLRIKLDFIIVPAINQLLDMSKVLYKIKNTSNEIKRWVLLISILSNITIVAQTTLYVETFTTTANDNKGRSVNVTDMSGVTTWTIGDLINGGSGTGTDADWVSGSYFKQTGGVFESFNTDAPNQSNPVSWFSNLVSISGYSNVTVSADLSRNSSNSGSGCEAFYSIDGGAYVSFGTLIGSATSPAAVSASGLCGSTIIIKICHWGTSSTPSYRHDNVRITGISLPEPTSNPTSFTANPNSNCTQMDLSFSAANTITNVSGYIILQKQGSLPTGTPSDRTSYALGNTIGDGTVVGVITNNSATNHTVTGLNSNTNYYYKIFPYYYDGSNSCTYNYYTGGTIANTNNTTYVCGYNPGEPTANPTTFTANIDPVCGRLVLNFSAANSITNTYGYLIIRKQGSAPTGSPVDATAYTAGNSIGDGTVAAVINSNITTSFTDNSLDDATQYYYSIFPFNYDGTNTSTYDYKTTSISTTQQTTIWCEDLVGNAAGAEGYHHPGIGIHGNYANWWSVNLYDKADMHNGGTSNVHNIISSICVDLNRSDPNWSSSAVSSTLNNINIYMANYSNVSTFPSAYTSQANLDAGTGVTWTLVYSGSITFAGLGWQQINLQTPFYYNGTGSLLVKFTRTSGNTPTNYPTFGFLSASPTSEIRNRNSTQVNSDYQYMKMAFNSTCTATINATGTILPVELIDFNATCNNENINLIWHTATELNNKGFVIERSNNGNDFIQIGKVEAKHNTDAIKEYSFIDYVASDEMNYYRLAQLDNDGKINYSNIISATNKCQKNDIKVLAFPNPSNGDINIKILSITKGQMVSLELINHIGETIYQLESNTMDIENFNINSKEFPSGIYFLKASANGKSNILKLIIE